MAVVNSPILLVRGSLVLKKIGIYLATAIGGAVIMLVLMVSGVLPIGTVAAEYDSPLACVDKNSNGVIDKGEVIAVINVYLFGDPLPTPAPTPTPTPGPTPTPAPTPTPTPEPTPTATPTPTTTPTPTATPLPEKVSGHGDSVVTDCTLKRGPNVFAISHTGTSNFIVRIIDDEGDRDLLINEIGDYRGSVLAFGGTAFWNQSIGPCTWEIRADGGWIIETTTPADGRTNGTGDDVTTCTLASGNNVFNVSHNGESNFIVRIYDQEGSRDLLINEIGQYDGTVLVRAGDGVLDLIPGPCTIEIKADGSWIIEPR